MSLIGKDKDFFCLVCLILGSSAYFSLLAEGPSIVQRHLHGHGAMKFKPFWIDVLTLVLDLS